MCDIEEPGRKASSALRSKAEIALAIIQRRVSWVWVTPFAGPVLPEVKKIAAGSEGSGWRQPVRRLALQQCSKRCSADSAEPP